MKKDIDDDFISIILEKELDELVDLLTPLVLQGYSMGWNMAAQAVGKADRKWSKLIMPQLLDVLEEQKNLIRGMGINMFKDMVLSLTGALASGASMVGIKEAIGKAIGISGSRAERIARTETLRALNAASNKLYDSENIVKGYEWSTVMDSVTRDSHSIMDGERIKKGDVFSNGLRYPLDPLGPPGEVINCRCIAIPLLEEVEENVTI